jgi:hypothetical protein
MIMMPYMPFTPWRITHKSFHPSAPGKVLTQRPALTSGMRPALDQTLVVSRRRRQAAPLTKMASQTARFRIQPHSRVPPTSG